MPGWNTYGMYGLPEQQQSASLPVMHAAPALTAPMLHAGMTLPGMTPISAAPVRATKEAEGARLQQQLDQLQQSMQALDRQDSLGLVHHTGASQFENAHVREFSRCSRGTCN